jgi:hypothetical protein
MAGLGVGLLSYEFLAWLVVVAVRMYVGWAWGVLVVCAHDCDESDFVLNVVSGSLWRRWVYEGVQRDCGNDMHV